MTDSPIDLRRVSPRLARVTFANPPFNLVTGETVRRLAEIVRDLADDDELQVLHLVSGVPEFFVNHFDLTRLADFPGADAATGRAVWTDLVLGLTAAPYLTVATIRGRTRGGGNELALALDLTYAGLETAFFGQPEVGTAVVPGGGGTERLPRLIGRSRALEAITTSQDYDAATADRWGWVTRAVPDAELDAHVDAVIQRLTAFDRTTLAAAKAMVNRASLPPEQDLVAAYGEFERSTTLPGYRMRAGALPTLSPEQARGLELDLGAFLGAAAVRRAAES